MVHFLKNSQCFIITKSVFCFGANVRSNDDPQQAQLRMIRDREVISLKNKLSVN